MFDRALPFCDDHPNGETMRNPIELASWMMVNPENEFRLLSMTVFLEAAGESEEGKIAVANVIANRVADSRYPDTIKGVVHQPWQFSCWNQGPDDIVWRNRRLNGYLESPAYLGSMKAAAGVFFGLYAENTEGSCHYCTTAVVEDTAWAKDQTPAVIIGAHSFFNQVA